MRHSVTPQNDVTLGSDEDSVQITLMSPFAVLLILVATLLTSFVSGIFGMAGGLILMGVLAGLVSVAMAMVIHGLIQMFANGYRAILLWSYISWRVFWLYCIGAVIGVSLLLAVKFVLDWVPETRMLYLLLGLTPLLVWLPKNQVDLDIQRRGHAVFAGFVVQGLNTLAGVAGPLLDLFFVRTDLTRQQIVATKAITQVLSHIIKVVFWSVPVITMAGWSEMPPWWLVVLALPLSLMGTRTGTLVLDRMNDLDFKRWMKGLVTIIGFIYLLRAILG